jgi:hypothetical protein
VPENFQTVSEGKFSEVRMPNREADASMEL